jgi:predicted membrane protein
VWVKGKQDSTEGIFLVHGPEGIMREIFGNIIEEVPQGMLPGFYLLLSLYLLVYGLHQPKRANFLRNFLLLAFFRILLSTNTTIPMVALPSLLAKIKPKSNKNATATQAKKETTAVACPTMVLGT